MHRLEAATGARFGTLQATSSLKRVRKSDLVIPKLDFSASRRPDSAPMSRKRFRNAHPTSEGR